MLGVLFEPGWANGAGLAPFGRVLPPRLIQVCGRGWGRVILLPRASQRAHQAIRSRQQTLADPGGRTGDRGQQVRTLRRGEHWASGQTQGSGVSPHHDTGFDFPPARQSDFSTGTSQSLIRTDSQTWDPMPQHG